MPRRCHNCDDLVYEPDWRTGLIHTTGRYVCRRGRRVATVITVAE